MFPALTIAAVLNFVIILLLAGCVIYAIYWFLGQLHLPDPIGKVIMAIIAIVGLLWLVQLLGIR